MERANYDKECIWRYGDFAKQTYPGMQSLGTGPYCSRTGKFLYDQKCFICSDDQGPLVIVGSTACDHVRDPRHALVVDRLLPKQEERKIALLEIDTMVDDLYGTIQCIPPAVTTCIAQCFVGGDVSKKASISELKSLCERYKKKEALVILELALWKAACFVNAPTYVNVDGMLAYLFGNGWKKNKTASRHDPLIGSVIANVLKFLKL